MVTQAGRKTILPVRWSRKHEGKLVTSSQTVLQVGRKTILPVRRSRKQDGKLNFQLDGHTILPVRWSNFQLDGHASRKENYTSSQTVTLEDGKSDGHASRKENYTSSQTVTQIGWKTKLPVDGHALPVRWSRKQEGKLYFQLDGSRKLGRKTNTSSQTVTQVGRKKLYFQLDGHAQDGKLNFELEFPVTNRMEAGRKKLYFQLDGHASRKENYTSSQTVTQVGRKTILPVRRSRKQDASRKENYTSSQTVMQVGRKTILPVRRSRPRKENYTSSQTVTQIGWKTKLPVRRSRKQEGKLYFQSDGHASQRKQENFQLDGLYFQLDGHASRKENYTSSQTVTQIGWKTKLPVRWSRKQEGKLYFQLDGHANRMEN